MKAEPGAVLPSLSVTLTRANLVRYAGAATDFNPIHWSDSKAAEVGLPGVIAHGMLTMGIALRVVTDWCGDPARVIGYQARFTRPVVVDDLAGATLCVSGAVTKVTDGIATVELDARCDDQKVLGSAIAEVRVD